jgi:predicted SAM-dependent methyltransferase
MEMGSSLSRTRVISVYLQGSGFKGLHIGAGTIRKQGWLNSDLPGAQNCDIGLDISEPLPFPDSSLHAIYGSEVIEHIPKERVQPFFKEALRVLKPKGVLRLTTPDLESICRIVLNQHEECTIAQLATTWLDSSGKLTRDEWINAMFRSWGHQYIWDYESLAVQLQNAGFSAIRRAPPQVTLSKYAELADQETRYGISPPPFMWCFSVIIEAVKEA